MHSRINPNTSSALLRLKLYRLGITPCDLLSDMKVADTVKVLPACCLSTGNRSRKDELHEPSEFDFLWMRPSTWVQTQEPPWSRTMWIRCPSLSREHSRNLLSCSSQNS